MLKQSYSDVILYSLSHGEQSSIEGATQHEQEQAHRTATRHGKQHHRVQAARGWVCGEHAMKLRPAPFHWVVQ